MADQPLGHLNRTLGWSRLPLMALGVVMPPLEPFGARFSVRVAHHPCCELNLYLLTLSDCINYPSLWNCSSKSISPSQDVLCMCSLLCIHFLQLKTSEAMEHLRRVFCLLASPSVKSFNFCFLASVRIQYRPYIECFQVFSELIPLLIVNSGHF